MTLTRRPASPHLFAGYRFSIALAAAAALGGLSFAAYTRSKWVHTPDASVGVALNDQEMAGIVGAFTRPKATHYSGCPYCSRGPGGNSGEQGTNSPHVDPTTGSVHDTVPGPSVNAVGGGVKVNFTYNSDMADGSNTALRMSMGYGWTHTYEMCLMESGRDVLWLHGDGSVTGFRNRFGTYQPLPGEFSTMQAVPGAIQVTTTDGTVHRFDRHVSANTPGDRWLPGTSTDANGRVTHYTYNGSNQLTNVVDHYGNSLHFTYDGNGRLSSVGDPIGRLVRLQYDTKANNLTGIIDPAGNVYSYTFSANQQMLAKAIYSAAMVATERYKLSWNTVTQRIAQIIDASGTPVYSAASSTGWSVNRDTSTSSSEMRYVPGTSTITDGLGHTWTYTYDDRGLLTRVDAPLVNGQPAVTTYTYDPGTLSVTSQTDPLGRVTTYQYDPHGNTTQTVDPQGNTTTYSYTHPTIPSLRTGVVDPAGRVTTYQYDAHGNQTGTVDALGHSTLYGYDADGRRTSTTDRNGHVTVYTYDPLSRLIVTTRDPAGLNLSTTTTYDSAGRVTGVTDPMGHTATFTYDPLDRQTSVVDPMGHTTTTVYDERGNRTSVTDPMGHTTTYHYDTRNRQTSTIDPMGATTTTAYDAAGNVTSTTDRNGHATTYQYDARNRQTTVIDAMGGVTTTQYDAADNRTSTTHQVAPADGPNRVTQYTYDSLNRVITETRDPLGLSVTTQYDYAPPGGGGCGCNGTPGAGNVHKTTDPMGRVTYTYYDAIDRKVSVVRKVGDTADNEGDADDAITRTTYDAEGNVIETRVENGPGASIVVDYDYDAVNRRTSQVRDPGGANLVTTYTYDANGNIIQSVNPAGNTTITNYDDANRQVSRTDSLGSVVTTAYDADGNVISVTDGMGHTTTTNYDADERATEVIDPLGGTTTTTYDADGNVTSVSDPLNHVTTTHYDANGRVTQTIDAIGSTTTTTYDAVGNVLTETTTNTTQSGPVNQTTTYFYDALDRRTSTRYADDEDGRPRQTTTFYDADGEVTQTISQNLDTTAYSYDELGRLTQRSFTPAVGSPTYPAVQGPETYAYDRASQLVTATHAETFPDPSSTLTFTYDGAGRLIHTTQDGRTVQYDYTVNPGTNRRDVTYDSGRTVREGYDARTRLTTVTDQPSGSPVGAFTYDAANRLTTTVRGSGGPGLTTTYTYDAIDRRVSAADGAPMSTQYTYDPAGNHLTTRRDHAADYSELYRYDSLNRVIDHKRGTLLPDSSDTSSLTANPAITQRQQFTYDENGNRLESAVRVNGADSCEDRYSNKANELIHGNGGLCPSPVAGPGVDYFYDDNGNLVSDATAPVVGGLTYDYDAANRLTRVRRLSDGVVVARYYYDALDRRIRKTVTNSGPLDGTTTFLYDHDWRVLAVYDGAGVLQREHAYGCGADQRICTDLNLVLDGSSIGPGDKRLFLLSDTVGSITAVTDDAGDIIEAYLYDAYGRQTVISDGPDGDAFVNFTADDAYTPGGVPMESALFTGREYDAETGLCYYRNRCYSPVLGRFLTRDPLGFVDGRNLYQYVKSNPSTLVDPSGLAEQTLTARTIQGPAMGYCGAFQWRIRWELALAAEKGSWIVQHITFRVHVENCWGQDITRAFGVNPVTEYWEGWPVSKGYRTDGYARQGGYSDQYSGRGFGLCTKGETAIIGDASYYADLARLPATFRTNNRATLAGILPATTVNPNLDGGTQPLAHEIRVTWNCCPRTWRLSQLAHQAP